VIGDRYALRPGTPRLRLISPFAVAEEMPEIAWIAWTVRLQLLNSSLWDRRFAAVAFASRFPSLQRVKI
jgi:hypothetical protein